MKHRSLAMAAIGLAAALAPIAASVQASEGYYYDKYGHKHYYHHRTCGAEKRKNGTTGAVVGGVGGAVVGAGLSHGSLGGTLIGAGAGALAGHAVGKHTTHC